ncbi:MAG: chromosome segregation protein SMC [Cyanobacteria bacterium M5B4]|nr:MAG: chromosome segregation protein SMC [Cyanobacteria bacterium M5B4]
MIPQKLVLKNFLSHPHTVLNFEGLHTACICGENGAGKSSLLEAITWVLWGKSRVETEDDLIHTGAAEVQVDFVLLNRGDCYRVIRTRSRGHASSLEVQVLRAGKFLSLTERGLRATQQLLIEHLKLDYETFIHSAYLRQGKADAFMLKRPQERKQVLAEILQLEQYDRLAEKAKEVARLTKGELSAINQQIYGLQQQISQSDRVDADLNRVRSQQLQCKQFLEEQEQQQQRWQQQQQQRSVLTQRLEWLQNQEQQLNQDIDKLTLQARLQYQQCQQLEAIIKQRSVIIENYHKYEQITAQLVVMNQKYSQFQLLTDRKQKLLQQLSKIETEIKLQICQYQTQLENLVSQQKQLQKIIDRQKEITEAQQQYQAAKSQLIAYDRMHAQVAPLQQRLHVLQRTIDQAKGNLTAKKENLYQTYEQLQQQLEQQAPLQQQLKDIDQQITLLQKKQVYQQRVHEKGLERRDFLERLKVRMNDCEEKLRQTQVNIQQIQSPQSNCPLCDQPLNLHHRDHVHHKHQQMLQELQSEIWLIKEQQSTSETEIKILREEYVKLRHELQPYNKLLEQKGSLQSQLQNLIQITDRLTTIEQEIIRIEDQLSQQSFAPEAQQEVKLLTASLEQLGYDEKDHALLRNEVERWRWAEIKSAELKQAQQQWHSLSEQIPKITTQIKQLTDRLQRQQFDRDLQNQINSCEQELQDLGYSYQLHQQLTKTKDDYGRYQLQYQELLLAEQQFPQLQQQYLHTQQNLQYKQETLQQLQQEQQQCHREIANYPDRSLELQNITIGIKRHRQQLEQYLSEIGRLEQLVHQIQLYQSQLQEIKAKQQALEYKQKIHQELAISFGKDGIQTLVIETIIPQIEAEANQILGQLSNYQLNLRFITQKSGKRSDKFIDTLEIEIADNQGTRAYETYSGGEAFRINFAVRLALSRILAQRTGGTLQTLIIDEGFGSQDEVGCERLVAAIETVSPDFACILVITHIPKLKEAFSTIIEVSKTNQGSHVHLVL